MRNASQAVFSSFIQSFGHIAVYSSISLLLSPFQPFLNGEGKLRSFSIIYLIMQRDHHQLTQKTLWMNSAPVVLQMPNLFSSTAVLNGLSFHNYYCTIWGMRWLIETIKTTSVTTSCRHHSHQYQCSPVARNEFYWNIFLYKFHIHRKKCKHSACLNLSPIYSSTRKNDPVTQNIKA